MNTLPPDKKTHSGTHLIDKIRPDVHFGAAQGGYLMFSIMVMLFVTSALLTLYVGGQTERGRLQRGEQLGLALSILGAGFDAYIDTHYTKLTAAQPVVASVADALHPTADELIHSVGITGATSIPPSIPGASYKFQVSFPPGCTPQQKLQDEKCHPVGLAYVDTPLMRGDKVDYVALAHAARVMKGRGGYSKEQDSSHFVFPDSAAGNGLIPIINPIGKSGVLAWRADVLFMADPGANAKHVKTDGSNRMKATLRMDGNNIRHDILGAREITASTLSSKALEVSGDENVKGRSTIGGDSQAKHQETVKGWLQTGQGISSEEIDASNNMTIMGRLSVLGSGLWTSSLNVSGNAIFRKSLGAAQSALNILVITSRENVGTRCEPVGLIGMSQDGYITYCSTFFRWLDKDYDMQWKNFSIVPYDFMDPGDFLKDIFPG